MMLMTKELAKVMPGPNSQEDVEDPLVYVHFFHCGSGWDWWAYEAWNLILKPNGEYDERKLSEPLKPGEKVEDVIFFGKVRGFETELGSFSLNELQSITGILKVERDLHWKPKPLSQCGE